MLIARCQSPVASSTFPVTVGRVVVTDYGDLTNLRDFAGTLRPHPLNGYLAALDIPMPPLAVAARLGLSLRPALIVGSD